MYAIPASQDIVRTANRLKVALTSDPSLAGDELRLATLIRDELGAPPRLLRIPSCLRDDG